MSNPKEEVALPGGPYQACLFDLDGVLTDTASVHDAAWKQMFDAFLQDWATRHRQQATPFDPVADYDDYVDGKPRYDGVRSFLQARDISLPDGDPSDPPGAETVCGLGNRKNELVLRLIDEKGVSAYPGSVRFLHAVRRAGIRTAVVSSSANCLAVIKGAGIDTCFDARVDGNDLADGRLAGKPAPDTFCEGARRLGLTPAQSVVFEDALAGVAAGRAGHFGLVVGVDRVGQAESLRAHGADVVVTDLAQLLSAP